jgi:hypothetical protein
MNPENAMAKDVLASLKSGVLLNGTVRSRSAVGLIEIAWIVIDLPVLGERVILVKNEQNLQSGQQVVIECVPNPLNAERYTFRMVEVLTPTTTVGPPNLWCCRGPRSKNCVQGRSKRTVRRYVASKR